VTGTSRTLPNNRDLALLRKRGVRRLGERIESLFERLARRVERCLRLRIVQVAVLIDLVTPSAEVFRREQFRSRADEPCREGLCLLRGKA
jgi:hypothetical protein